MIRPFQNEDLLVLLDIFKLNTPKYFDPAEVHDFEEYLTQKSETYLTIEDEGRIVGGAGYFVNADDQSGRITWIFFHPDAAGKGFGKQVVEHCLSVLRNDSRVQKLVVTTSQLTYQFFSKFGYKLVRTEKDYWGPGLDLYLMEQAVVR